MRTILDVLRLRLDAGLSERHTARSLGVPRTTVQDYLARFRGSGLAWPLAPHLDDAALECALFARDPALPAASRPLPDWTVIAREKKRKGVTLYLLWQEYRSVEPDGYGYIGLLRAGGTVETYLNAWKMNRSRCALIDRLELGFWTVCSGMSTSRSRTADPRAFLARSRPAFVPHPGPPQQKWSVASTSRAPLSSAAKTDDTRWAGMPLVHRHVR